MGLIQRFRVYKGFVSAIELMGPAGLCVSQGFTGWAFVVFMIYGFGT